MIVKISGLVMEIRDEYSFEDKKKLATETAVLYQRGEKTLIQVKKVPGGLFTEGEVADDILVRVFPYAFDRGDAQVSFSYVEGQVHDKALIKGGSK